MNIQKAIETTETSELSLRDNKFIVHADALKLLIEAGKRIEDWRAGRVLNPDFMLPGETED